MTRRRTRNVIKKPTTPGSIGGQGVAVDNKNKKSKNSIQKIKGNFKSVIYI